MGTFSGHALPGSFFVLWSLFHTYQICYRYFRAQLYIKQHQRKHSNRAILQRRCTSSDSDDGNAEEDTEAAAFIENERVFNRNQTSQTTFYSSNIYYCCGFRRWPVDSCLKILAAIVGITGETITAVDSNWNIINYGNLQHIAMFGMFGLFGAVEALNFCNYPALPRGADYGVLILAYAAEAILFSFHLDHQQMLEMTLHRLLIYTVWACALASLLEMAYRRNVMAALARIYFTLLQGFWFFVVGFILYNPFSMNKEKPMDHDNDMMNSAEMQHEVHNRMMVTVALYVLAAGTTVVLMLIISMLSYLAVITVVRQKRRMRIDNLSYYDKLPSKMLSADVAVASRDGGDAASLATLPLAINEINK